jgi:RND family efflux transporter MFP subunit
MEEKKEQPGTRPLRVYVWGAFLLAAVTAATWFGVNHFKKPNQLTLIEGQAMDMSLMVPPAGIVPVAIEEVKSGPFAASVRCAGTVAPYEEQEVFPRAEGRIVEMPVYPGDEVKKGALLARLDAPELSFRTASAEQEAQGAQDSAVAMDDEVARMESELDAMKSERDSAAADTDFRDRELVRMEELYKNGAVSRSEIEQERSMNAQSHAMLRKSKASVGAAQSDLENAGKRRKSMRSMSRSGSLRADSERIVEGYLEIHSELNGVVTQRLVSPGTLARQGVAILKVARIDRVRLQANLGESDAARIEVGNQVRVTTPRRPGKVFDAKVTSIFPATDPTARTSVIEAAIDNPKNVFLPGDYVSMEIGTGEKPEAISVPDRAIVRWGNGGKPAVWAMVSGEDGKPRARLKTVAIGLANGDATEIVSGLVSGDRVVVDGGAELREGDVLFATAWGPDGPHELPRPAVMDTNMPGMDMGQKKSVLDENMNNMPGMDSGGKSVKKNANDKSKQKLDQSETIYTCPMHPQIRKKKPGKCPICGMNLVPIRK